MTSQEIKKRLTALAGEFGFTECAFAAPDPVHQEGPLHPQAAVLASDAASLMPEAKCVMLCAIPYLPFRLSPDQAHVDAYYLTSNRAHEQVQAMARAITESLGIAALASPPIFIKPLAARSGLGEFGRSGLVSVGSHGTRVSIQAILLGADIEPDAAHEKQLSPLCEGCSACMNACPMKALDGSGRVDISLCLRAQPEGEPFPEEMRDKLGGSLLGCDICQRVCPRNRQVGETPMPTSLSEALDLEALLKGQYKPLIPFLGKNNARRQRLTARALIAAANLGRSDLLPLVDSLTGCRESEMVREHAVWAMEQLSGE